MFSLPSKRGQIFDIAMCLSNGLAMEPLAKWITISGHHPSNGAAITCLFLYSFGILLITPSVVTRMARQYPDRKWIPPSDIPSSNPSQQFRYYATCSLILLHFLLFEWIATLAAERFSPGTNPSNTLLSVFFGMAVAGVGILPTLCLVRAIIPPDNPFRLIPRPNRQGSAITEGVGDVALIISTTLIMALYRQTFEQIFAGACHRPLAFSLLTFGAGLFLLTMFYLAPRLVYLAQDYRFPPTWIGIGFALAPAVYHLLFSVST
jgi:hypothetical protein